MRVEFFNISADIWILRTNFGENKKNTRKKFPERF